MPASSRPEDFGSFRLEVQNEEEWIGAMAQKAMVNKDRPGHWWSRLVAQELDTSGKPLGICTWHLDLNEGRVEVVEVWNGHETARRSFSITLEYN